MNARSILPAVVFVAGTAAVAVGVALVSVPAGLIVAGAEAIATSVLYVRGAR